MVKKNAGIRENEAVPYVEGIPGVSLSCLVPDDIEVSLGNGWQDATEVGFDVGSATEKAGERFRGAFGVSFDGKAHFGESRLKFPLPQKEIAVTPRDLSGKRGGLFGVQKSVARSDKIGFRFVSGGKIQPDFRRGGIQRQSRKVGVNGAASFGILEVVLPIAAQEIPIARVSGLQVDGPLIGFGGLQTCVVGGERISNAEVREENGNNARDGYNNTALAVGGETQNHSPVLCLGCFGGARQLSIAARDKYLSQ